MTRFKTRGFTVLEMFTALAIFSGIMIVTTMLLKQSVWVWTAGDSREDASMVLSKARTALNRDLLQADLDPGDSGELHFGMTQTPAGLGGGDAVWFLSAAGPDGSFERNTGGIPHWQRNVLYYLAKPQGHDALYKMSCSSGSNPNGDDVCPHKMLVRVVIDNPPVTVPWPDPPADPGPGDVPEELIDPSAIGSYLIAPDGLSVASIIAQPGVEEARIITTGLLWFKVAPAPGAPAAGLELDLRALAIKEASKIVPVGNVSVLNDPKTIHSVFSLFPNN